MSIKMDFTGKTILITGGTGSLGQRIVKRLMSGEKGQFKKIIIFSRDEDKHYQMILDLKQFINDKNNFFWGEFKDLLKFIVGDVRDYISISSAMKEADIVIHAAAMKQVPLCEYFPFESVKTNILGMENIVRSIKENYSKVQTVVVISTDKACLPVNTYGMCKAIQERIAIESNISINKKGIRIICVRYGNVMGSRGSVIPLFQKQILMKKSVTVTSEKMTRFMMSLNNSVDTIFTAMDNAYPGEIYVPIIVSARIIDIANIMIEGRNLKKEIIGIRPGEKIHEILLSEEELLRSIKEGNYFVITPSFLELKYREIDNGLSTDVSSNNFLLSKSDLKRLLEGEGHLNF